MANELDVQVEIEAPLGWLALEDMLAGYELHAESFASAQHQSRIIQAEGDWVEGSYAVRAVEGNVTEALSVWVKGEDPYQLAMRIQALTDGLHQLQYRLRLTFGNLREEWVCQYSDYTIESDQNLRFSTLALVKAQVPHLPTVTRTLVP
jgi:hypothetical protein